MARCSFSPINLSAFHFVFFVAFCDLFRFSGSNRRLHRGRLRGDHDAPMPGGILRACRRRAVSVYSAAMNLLSVGALVLGLFSHALVAYAADPPPAVPRFSIEYMDRSVDPS